MSEYVQSEDDLGDRRRRFVKEYLQDMTATQAARRAGYTGNKAGEKLMSSYQVRATIKDELNAQLERIGFSADDVVRGICRVAFGDPRALFADDRLKRPSEWTEAEAQQVNSFVVTMRTYPDGTVDTTTRVQLSDRLRALDQLARRVWPEFSQQVPVDPGTVQSIIDEQSPEDCRVVLYIPHNGRDPLPPGRWVDREPPERYAGLIST